jgi:hypothetical protein
VPSGGLSGIRAAPRYSRRGWVTRTHGTSGDSQGAAARAPIRGRTLPTPCRLVAALADHLHAARVPEGVAAMEPDWIVEELHAICEALSRASGGGRRHPQDR